MIKLEQYVNNNPFIQNYRIKYNQLDMPIIKHSFFPACEYFQKVIAHVNTSVLLLQFYISFHVQFQLYFTNRNESELISVIIFNVVRIVCFSLASELFKNRMVSWIPNTLSCMNSQCRTELYKIAHFVVHPCVVPNQHLTYQPKVCTKQLHSSIEFSMVQ